MKNYKNRAYLHKLLMLSGLIWVCSIISFFGSSFLFRAPTYGFYTDNQSLVMSVSAFIGVFSFLLLAATIMKLFGNRLIRFLVSKKFIIFFMIGMLALGLISIRIYGSYNSVNRASTPTSVDCVINGIKTTAISKEVCDGWTNLPTPTIKPTGVYVPQPSATAVPQLLDTDMITCRSNQCGQTLITRSACQTAVCCEVGNGWYWYSSDSRCTDVQNAYWKTYYDILYGNTAAQTPMISTPIQADYSTDYTSLLDNFKKQNAADAASLQKQLDTIYSGTMQNINNDINSVKAGLTPASVQYTTWGEYYADHPHEIMQHNPSDLFGN